MQSLELKTAVLDPLGEWQVEYTRLKVHLYPPAAHLSCCQY